MIILQNDYLEYDKLVRMRKNCGQTICQGMKNFFQLYLFDFVRLKIEENEEVLSNLVGDPEDLLMVQVVAQTPNEVLVNTIGLEMIDDKFIVIHDVHQLPGLPVHRVHVPVVLVPASVISEPKNVLLPRFLDAFVYRLYFLFNGVVAVDVSEQTRQMLEHVLHTQSMGGDVLLLVFEVVEYQFGLGLGDVGREGVLVDEEEVLQVDQGHRVFHLRFGEDHLGRQANGRHHLLPVLENVLAFELAF